MSEVNQDAENSENLELPPVNDDETEKSDDLPENHSDGENNSDEEEKSEGENQSEEQHEPNVKFVGRREVLNKQANKPHTVSIEAPTHVNDGDDLIELPSSGEQKKGFYHPKANVLFQLFPDDYKPFVPKGE